MRLLLSRHGNTFGPGDPVVWAGSANDLPLVSTGVLQAQGLARMLVSQGIQPAAIYCGPLKRTRRYAEIVAERLREATGVRLVPVVDPRLDEIDYGEWTGLTNEQVAQRFGEAALKGWDERARWPTVGGWGRSPEQLSSEVRGFVAELRARHAAAGADGAADSTTILAVTSNGRLRYFLSLVDDELERRAREGTFKVKTGHVCRLAIDGDQVSVEYWNLDPAQMR